MDMISNRNSAPIFKNIKAIKFSADNDLLYILSNSPEKILVFDVDAFLRGEPCCRGEMTYKTTFNITSQQSLGMKDLELLSDGWIASCSTTLGRFYLNHYADGVFDSPILIQFGADGYSLGDPEALTYDRENDLCYILGSSKKLHVVGRSALGQDYEIIATVTLPTEFNSAHTMAYINNDMQRF